MTLARFKGTIPTLPICAAQAGLADELELPKMNRRSFLALFGLAPAMPVVKALAPDDELAGGHYENAVGWDLAKFGDRSVYWVRGDGDVFRWQEHNPEPELTSTWINIPAA